MRFVKYVHGIFNYFSKYHFFVFIVIMGTVTSLFSSGCSPAVNLGSLFMKENLQSPKRIIYVYWSQNESRNPPQYFDISLNGEKVGVIGCGGYLPIVVDTGKYNLKTGIKFNFGSVALLDIGTCPCGEASIDVKDSTEYYLECIPELSIWCGHNSSYQNNFKLNLQQVKNNLGTEKIKFCRKIIKEVTKTSQEDNF